MDTLPVPIIVDLHDLIFSNVKKAENIHCNHSQNLGNNAKCMCYGLFECLELIYLTYDIL